MSLKPGLAKDWFLKFHTDVYPADYVVLRGKKMKPPKYYDSLLQRVSNMSWEYDLDTIKDARELAALAHLDNSTPARLAVREAVQIAQISKLVKTL